MARSAQQLASLAAIAFSFVAGSAIRRAAGELTWLVVLKAEAVLAVLAVLAVGGALRLFSRDRFFDAR